MIFITMYNHTGGRVYVFQRVADVGRVFFAVAAASSPCCRPAASPQIFRTFGGRGWGLRLSDERGAEAGTVLHEYLGEVCILSPNPRLSLEGIWLVEEYVAGVVVVVIVVAVSLLL